MPATTHKLHSIRGTISVLAPGGSTAYVPLISIAEADLEMSQVTEETPGFDDEDGSGNPTDWTVRTPGLRSAVIQFAGTLKAGQDAAILNAYSDGVDSDPVPASVTYQIDDGKTLSFSAWMSNLRYSINKQRAQICRGVLEQTGPVSITNPT